MAKPRPGDESIVALYPAAPWAEILATLKQGTGQDWSVDQVRNRACWLGVRRERPAHGARRGIDQAESVIRADYPTADLWELAARLTKDTGVGWAVKDIHNAATRLGLRRSVDQRNLPPALGTMRPPRVVSCERAVLCACNHIPFHDRDLLADMLRIARRDKCDTLIEVGDFVDCAAFSKWDREAPTVEWKREVDTANRVLYELARTFAHVYILPGNHEYRILRQMQGQLTWGNVMAGWEIVDILADSGRPTIENIPVILIEDWALACHPDNYSRVPGSVGAQLAAKYQRSVFTGHEHSLSLRMDVSGRHLCVGLGVMCREDLIDYLNMHVKTNPFSNPGFVTVIDREVRLYPKGRFRV